MKNPLDYFRQSGSNVIETDTGWANYYVFGEECYIEIMFIYDDERKKGSATKLADIITEKAKEAGCKYLSTTICTSKPDVERSLRAILSYGFKFYKADEKSIWFAKEL
jgi:GNAT superfamily N-acetyltransferase